MWYACSSDLLHVSSPVFFTASVFQRRRLSQRKQPLLNRCSSVIVSRARQHAVEALTGKCLQQNTTSIYFVDAPRTEIEHCVFLNLSNRCSMRALHIID